jgi:hypothetical protein
VECRFRQPGWEAASVQEVAPVHHDIDIAAAGRREGPVEVLKEVVGAPTANDARTLGQVEAEMRVGHEQHAHATPTRAQTPGAPRGPTGRGPARCGLPERARELVECLG